MCSQKSRTLHACPAVILPSRLQCLEMRPDADVMAVPAALLPLQADWTHHHDMPIPDCTRAWVRPGCQPVVRQPVGDSAAA